MPLDESPGGPWQGVKWVSRVMANHERRTHEAVTVITQEGDLQCELNAKLTMIYRSICEGVTTLEGNDPILKSRSRGHKEVNRIYTGLFLI